MLTETMIRDAESIRNSLSAAVRDLELALDRDMFARRTLTDAKQLYGDAEAEVKFELIHGVEGRNAEQRSAAVDIGLIRSRNEGALFHTWAHLLASQNAADEAKVALEQMSRRYRATETAADLIANMLRALSR